MAWQGTSDRRGRLPADWKTRRARVLARDGYRCVAEDDGVRCGEAATDVDHIVRGDDHDEANLQSLCAWHHKRKTAREAREARRPRPDRRRPRERHPGLL